MFSLVWFVIFPDGSDCGEGPGRFSPAAWLPFHHIHPGRHQKRPAQTHRPAWAAVTQRRCHSRSAIDLWSPGRQLSPLPQRDSPNSPALWCGAVFSLVGYCSRGVSGRKPCVTYLSQQFEKSYICKVNVSNLFTMSRCLIIFLYE